VTTEGREVRIVVPGVGSNGWIEATLQFPQGGVIPEPPAWQRRAEAAAAQAPLWISIAGALFLAGLVLFAAWRQTYDRPPDAETWTVSTQPVPPDDLGPATAGVLAANGSVRLEHAMAALLSLADRGEVAIRETPHSFGRRDFQLQRPPAAGRLAEWEGVLLDIVFGSEAGPARPQPLSHARRRLTRHLRRFSAALRENLRAAGFLDEGRERLRRRYQKTSVVLFVVGLGALAMTAVLSRGSGAWPGLVGTAVLVLALVSLMFAATITPLSNEGVRRSRRWRAYHTHLKDVSRGARSGPGPSATAILPFAVALGLANAWAKLLKHQRHTAPPWFHAAADDGGAFPAFVAAGGAGAGGGAHGGGGGGGAAAGGGASGAH
jgi:uncharacterized protein (TIGR04222 family)